MNRRPPERDGFLNIDKPAGMTSRDVVDRVCRVVGSKRVGHSGTLDPLATGVLVVAVGKATRLVEYVQAQRKVYRAGLLLGQTSDTDDVEGTILHRKLISFPLPEVIDAALRPLVGRILQTPPKFSAIKLQGKRAYDLARSGADVKMSARAVDVFRMDLLRYAPPRLELEIECGSGTYIRSIARDLGEMLGVGGLMEWLERTGIGVFKRADAVGLEQLELSDWRETMRPLLDGCAGLPVMEVGDQQRRHFDAGRSFLAPQSALTQTGEFAAVQGATLIGIGRYDARTGVVRPVKGGFGA